MRTRTRFAALAIVIAVGLAPAAAAEAAKKTTFSNCTDMHKTYKHGVAKSGAKDKVRGSTKPKKGFTVSTAIYNLNKRMDRDNDGVACEA